MSMKLNVSKEQRSWGLIAFLVGAAIAVFISSVYYIGRKTFQPYFLQFCQQLYRKILKNNLPPGRLFYLVNI